MAKKVKLEDVNKLSDIIRIAVADCKKVQKLKKKFKLDMGTLFEPCLISGKCQVCMAGAVMAMSLKADPAKRRGGFGGYNLTLANKPEAIDLVRTGHIIYALNNLAPIQSNSKVSKLVEIEDSIKKNIRHNSRRADWRTYLRAANKLEKLGY